ncbi:choice-of-anchor Q domain-containing protein [Methylomicrobium lacus]|uniref:choice-of-anchor Q domain-containing protein n=1 Tax=Methylomicrobium lacus TaxID=136992 RepID=UPI0035A8EDA9
MKTKISQNYLRNTASVVWAVMLIGSSASASAATTYYVSTSGSDSNSGTQSQPWRSITKAATTMRAGDTAIVSAGTYNEAVTTNSSGASGSKITFRASGSVTVTGGFAIKHAYNTVDGFSINKDLAISAGNCEVLNNHFINARIYMPSGNPANCLLKGNHIESTNSWGGDWVAFDLGGSNHIVENNEIGPSKDTDVFRPFGTGHIIRNNYIHDITLSPGSGAHMDIFQVFADNGEISNNIVFENNRIINSEGQMCMTSSDGLTGIHDFDVRNNLWVNVAMQCNVGIPYFRFYGNTLYNVGATNGFAFNVWIGPAGNPNHARIMNNIFIAAGGLNATSAGGAYGFPAGSTDMVGDYNFIARGPGSGYAKVSGFTEAHGINGGDPKFVGLSTNDFRLQAGSPTIDKGTTISGLTYDLDGLARPQGAANDIGAFEYNSSGSSIATNTVTLVAPQNLRVQ